MDNLNKAIEKFDEHYNNIVKDINSITNNNIDIESINDLLSILETSSDLILPMASVISEISLKYDIPYEIYSSYLANAGEILEGLYKLLYPTKSTVIHYNEYCDILESMNKVSKCMPTFLNYNILTSKMFHLEQLKKYLEEIEELKIELGQVNSFITDTEAFYNEVIYKHLNPSEVVSWINSRIKHLESDISEEIDKLGDVASQLRKRFKYVVEW